MARTTIGIKIDEETRERLRALAAAKDRAPHGVVKEALADGRDAGCPC